MPNKNCKLPAETLFIVPVDKHENIILESNQNNWAIVTSL